MKPVLFATLTVLAVAILAAGLSGCGNATQPGGNANAAAAPQATTVRLGYFANITHAQALIGLQRGEFQKRLGDNIKIDTKVFNAGPSAVEALFAGEIDLTYIGPSPALNAHIKSNGKAVRIVAGGAANGVAIIVRKDAKIGKMEELAGKKIATPQFGNTQDVSARHYLLKTLNAKLKESGGDTEILTIANADQINLFRQGQIDAAWAPEPWGARLVHETGGVLLAEEKDMWPDKRFTTAVVLASAGFLEKNPELVEKFLRAHSDVTAWINANRPEAATLTNGELQKLVGKALKPEVLTDAFLRVEFTTDPLKASVVRFAEWSKELGFAKEVPDVEGLFDLKLLDKINAETPAK